MGRATPDQREQASSRLLVGRSLPGKKGRGPQALQDRKGEREDHKLPRSQTGDNHKLYRTQLGDDHKLYRTQLGEDHKLYRTWGKDLRWGMPQKVHRQRGRNWPKGRHWLWSSQNHWKWPCGSLTLPHPIMVPWIQGAFSLIPHLISWHRWDKNYTQGNKGPKKLVTTERRALP